MANASLTGYCSTASVSYESPLLSVAVAVNLTAGMNTVSPLSRRTARWPPSTGSSCTISSASLNPFHSSHLPDGTCCHHDSLEANALQRPRYVPILPFTTDTWVPSLLIGNVYSFLPIRNAYRLSDSPSAHGTFMFFVIMMRSPGYSTRDFCTVADVSSSRAFLPSSISSSHVNLSGASPSRGIRNTVPSVPAVSWPRSSQTTVPHVPRGVSPRSFRKTLLQCRTGLCFPVWPAFMVWAVSFLKQSTSASSSGFSQALLLSTISSSLVSSPTLALLSMDLNPGSSCLYMESSTITCILSSSWSIQPYDEKNLHDGYVMAGVPARFLSTGGSCIGSPKSISGTCMRSAT